ncbi:hypothetical protein M0813_13086 [Anaeramoeba flamelloides]|uniref:PAS domain-containing protein n=1 Tax=Anaeramoeba flamelloides TaxID=1746091 RepID=A0ABQ8Z9V1_9EUKA|nr:hypothetical protein M0813_13086 [Anaeramoeba flamelloides]
MGNSTPHKTLSQKSWKKYLRMISKSKDAILLIDENVHFSYLNRKAAKMLKITNRKNIKLTPTSISPLKQPHLEVDSASGSKVIIKNLVKSKDGTCDFIWQHQTVNGELFYVRSYLTILRVKEKLHCQCIWIPIKNINEIFSNSFETFELLNSFNSHVSVDSSNGMHNSINSLNSLEKNITNYDLNSQNTDNSEYSEGSLTSNLMSESGSLNSIFSMDSSEINNLNSTKPKIRKKKNTLFQKQLDTPTMIDNYDLEEEFAKFQDNIKKAVCLSNNDIQQTVCNELEEFKTNFYSSNKNQNIYIQKISQQQKNILKQSRNRYRKLENNLQKRNLLFSEERKKQKALEMENQQLKKNISEISSILDQQKHILDTFNQFLNRD